MGNYAFGFTINRDSVNLAVVKKTMFGYRLRIFIESPLANTPEGLSRDKIITALTEIFDHDKFAIYRKRMENKRNRFHLAVAIPPEFVWMFQIPFLSVDDLFDSHTAQKAIDKIINYKILHPKDILAYDSFAIDDLRNPHLQILITFHSILDELLGNSHQDSVFEHTGLQKPTTIISFNQALLSFYSTVFNTSHQCTVFVYLHENNVDFTFLENRQIHKIQTIRNPNFGDTYAQHQKLQYCRHLLFYIRLFIMHRISDGKIAQCIFLFGESKYISIEELHDFLKAVLGKTRQEIDLKIIHSIFGNSNLDEILPAQYQQDIDDSTQLKNYIYEKMLEQELYIKIVAISPTIMKKFKGKRTYSGTISNSLAEENFSGTSIMKTFSDFTPSSKQILPFGAGLHCFFEEQQPNLAKHGNQKKYSVVERVIQGYLPDSVLNVLICITLLYVAATGYKYWQTENSFENYRNDQFQGLNTLSRKYEEINWNEMRWETVNAYETYSPKPVSFFDIRKSKIPWSFVLQIINTEWEKLPKSTIIKTISFEIGLDDKGEKAFLIHIHGEAISATDVMKVLSKSDYITRVKLATPIETNSNLESFYIIASYE